MHLYGKFPTLPYVLDLLMSLKNIRKIATPQKQFRRKSTFEKLSKFFKFWTGVEMDYIHFPVFETFCINIVHVRFKKFSTMKVLKIK